MAAYVVERINEKVVSLGKKTGPHTQIRRASSFASLAPAIAGASGMPSQHSSPHHHHTIIPSPRHRSPSTHQPITLSLHHPITPSLHHQTSNPSPPTRHGPHTLSSASTSTHHGFREREQAQEWWDEQGSAAINTLCITRIRTHTAPTKKNQLVRERHSFVRQRIV